GHGRSSRTRKASRHGRGLPSEKITVNSEGISGYSAMIFTPPSDMSEIMQSRGNPPVANCIFAKLLHARRSLLRRFAYMSIPDPARCDSPMDHLYRRIVGIGLSQRLAM